MAGRVATPLLIFAALTYGAITIASAQEVTARASSDSTNEEARIDGRQLDSLGGYTFGREEGRQLDSLGGYTFGREDGRQLDSLGGYTFGREDGRQLDSLGGYTFGREDNRQ
uniref:Glycine rich superfamily member n=1 Tax=Rhipicephalus appendiculatus TaxID=34631 RepID=A0A131YFA6_RHIAP